MSERGGDAQELSDELDLEYWCEREGLAYRKGRGSSGMQLNMRECPECGDRRYRVYLNAETGLGNCFVCNAGFNKLKFVNANLGLSWAETFNHVREVLKEQGWKPKRTTTAAVEFGEVKLPVSFPLPTGEGQNLLYLEKRGISGDLAKFFHLRFCTDGWWNFLKEDGSQGGQKFVNRLIIPVFDLDGKLVTFQGRDVIGDQSEKYLFPKGLPGTGRFLFNGQNALRAKRVVMGEGAFDVMAIKKAFDEKIDLRDVVPIGSFGKHLSFGSVDGKDQLGCFLQLKRAGLEEVTIMWDGEWRALVSALDAAKQLRRIGLRVRIALLPSNCDPNEVLPEVVQDAFYKATVYSATLDVKWRLRNHYADQKQSVSFDC
ncbi:DNA primase [Faunimonas pinastri]|uniref:DNA primase n=1 Tax=Faunimonas pinastri TaxID=1855383 RepID=A0A1H9N094_9HYPH|nr:hypothetical protein [Faunimonas pinastri]SER29374.1 DNA primase [Faunimonas pinastri]